MIDAWMRMEKKRRYKWDENESSCKNHLILGFNGEYLLPGEDNRFKRRRMERQAGGQRNDFMGTYVYRSNAIALKYRFYRKW